MQPEGNYLEILMATNCDQCRFTDYVTTGTIVNNVIPFKLRINVQKWENQVTKHTLLYVKYTLISIYQRNSKVSLIYLGV